MNRILSSFFGKSGMGKVVLGISALTCIALFTLAGEIPSAAVAGGTATKLQPSKVARSSADLAASLMISQEQGISQWFVKGVVKNIGGRDYVGSQINGKAFNFRLATLEQITGKYMKGQPLPKVVKLAETRIVTLRAGQSVTLSKVLNQHPAAGTRFLLVISGGDLHSENDQAVIIYNPALQSQVSK